MDLNKKHKTTQLLEDNIGVNLHDLCMTMTMYTSKSVV